jgi:TRAP-type C4-dicarboxylate transport system permease large subunit
LRGRLTRSVLVEALRSTAAATGMIYVAIFGASIMSYFIGLTRVSDELVALLQGMNIPPLAVISLLVVMYLVLGAVFDETAAMLITLPFVLPIVTGFGYDPVWWGIINLVVINLGMVIPPIGMNVFLLHGLSPDIPLRSIYRGVLPFIGIDLIRLALLILFPSLSLWLVQALR